MPPPMIAIRFMEEPSTVSSWLLALPFTMGKRDGSLLKLSDTVFLMNEQLFSLTSFLELCRMFPHKIAKSFHVLDRRFRKNAVA